MLCRTMSGKALSAPLSRRPPASAFRGGPEDVLPPLSIEGDEGESWLLVAGLGLTARRRL